MKKRIKQILKRFKSLKYKPWFLISSVLVIFAACLAINVIPTSTATHTSSHINTSRPTNMGRKAKYLRKIDHYKAMAQFTKAQYYTPSILHHDKYVQGINRYHANKNNDEHLVFVTLKPKYNRMVSKFVYLQHHRKFTHKSDQQYDHLEQITNHINTHLNSDSNKITNDSNDKEITIRIHITKPMLNRIYH